MASAVRQRPCQRCGADEWQQRKGGRWYCAPCDRRTSAKRQESHGGALRLLENARYRAQKKGEDFSITLDDVKRAWPADDICPALGIVLRKVGVKVTDASPSLDRINPAWGYTPDNVAVISHAANRIKNNARASDLERIAAWMRSRGLD